MENTKYYFAVTYTLKVGEEQEVMEETTAEQPLCFYSGLGMMLDKFEKELMSIEPLGKFDFTIPCAEAYGEYDDNGVIDLPKNIFEVDGKIDERILFEGNMVPLMDSEGQRINASVVAVGKDTVTVDLNHPLAGEDLHFIGQVIVKREASEEEIKEMFSSKCGGCGGGNCGSCGGNCDDEGDCNCEGGCGCSK